MDMSIIILLGPTINFHGNVHAVCLKLLHDNGGLPALRWTSAGSLFPAAKPLCTANAVEQKRITLVGLLHQIWCRAHVQDYIPKVGMV
jgi:hypothetical protein